MACFVEASGLGPLEGASVSIKRNGRVALAVGSPPQGQGHETTLAQVCADELGISVEAVDVTLGDTERLSYGTGTFASRTAVVGGNAVRLASRAVKERAIQTAAKILNTPAEELAVSEGKVFRRQMHDKCVSFGEIAAIAAGSVPGGPFPDGIQPGLETSCYFTPSSPTYANGAHVAVVQIDPHTGFVKILRYAVAHNCGKVINPMIVDGQIHGGVAHGIGDALIEKLHYDENGQLQTTSYLSYLIPTASDVPFIRTEHIEIPSRFNPLGVKGAGEAGAIGAPAAIANAIADALSPVGVSIREFPLSPNRIWQLIKERGA